MIIVNAPCRSESSLYSQFYDSRAHGFISDLNPGHCDGKLEAVGTGAAGIQEQDSVSIRDRRTVGMAQGRSPVDKGGLAPLIFDLDKKRSAFLKIS